ncbi:MAG: hypothetical protein EA392_03205 [Cryomorphaceae bacterium]|nr:MAG: hypothetical protein EA392_03205 [Cryomorphaceae bacterium]
MNQQQVFSALTFIGELGKEDIGWVLSNAIEQQLIQGELVVKAGELPGAMYVVIHGLMEVKLPGSHQEVTLLGPGECFSEVSFIDGQMASADVRARENTMLLVLPAEVLSQHLDTDECARSTFYKAFAVTLATRLRKANALVQSLQSKAADTEFCSDSESRIYQMINALQEGFFHADQEAIKSDNGVKESTTLKLREGFSNFVTELNQLIGDKSTLNLSQRAHIGARVQQAMLPYLTLSELGDRMYAKPRGYAGDYLTIDQIYKNSPAGSGRLGELLDQCFLDQSAGKAVQNRRGLMVEEITATLKERNGELTRVTSLACGPAAELFDVYANMNDPNQLQCTCVDIDFEALAHISARTTPRLKNCLKLTNANLVYLALGRSELNLPPQDIIYSIGLIDYFNDKFVVNLLNFIYGKLKKGGRVILGNFHPANETRALMDYVLDWKLIHRTEEDMHRLFLESAFNSRCEQIRFEQTGINLFAIGRKS